MKKMAFLGITLCGLMSNVVLAQAQNQAPPAPTYELFKAPMPLGVVPVKPGSDHYNVHLKGMTAIQAIEALARGSNRKVLFSDEVRAQEGKTAKIEIEFEDIPLLDLLNQLCRPDVAGAPGLAWGNAGPNNWLVVTRPIDKSNISVNTNVPRLTPTNPPMLNAVPDIPKEEKEPGKPFYFNGQKYYVVPLH